MSHYRPYPAYKDSEIDWLGGARIPAHWEACALRWHSRMQSGDFITAEAIETEGSYPVYGGNGLRGYTTRFTHDGHHVLIGRQGALCGNVNFARGQFWASEHAVVVTPNRECDTRWLGEILRAMDLNQYSVSAAQPGLAVERIKALEIPIPPLKEQAMIGRALDRETARIDALVAKKTRFIELLKEKRQALITQAVTKGLDPKVKLKDSGVEWIGQVPAHWYVFAVKRLFRERDERSVRGDEEMMTVSHLTGVTPRSEKNVNMFEAESTEGYKICRPGDLVINTLWAWMGAMGTARQLGIVSPAYNIYIPGQRLDPDYVDLLVRMPVFAKEVTRFSKGIRESRLRLYPEGFFEVQLAVPPVPEQRLIVDRVRGKAMQIESLAAKTQLSIDLLKERRSALIAAAVTGQIDLREAA